MSVGHGRAAAVAARSRILGVLLLQAVLAALLCLRAPSVHSLLGTWKEHGCMSLIWQDVDWYKRVLGHCLAWRAPGSSSSVSDKAPHALCCNSRGRFGSSQVAVTGTACTGCIICCNTIV